MEDYGGDFMRAGIGGQGGDTSTSYSAEAPIGSSNIGFQLLKKHGWKEGTGLGISEQGRLEPVEAHVKKNKRGLGAEKFKKQPQRTENSFSDTKTRKVSEKKPRMTKRMRKIEELEKQMQEKEFDRAFFRDFWPDNV